MKRLIRIGLPELSDEDLTEIASIAQDEVLKRIEESISRSDLIDVDVTVRVVKGETLDLEIEVSFEVPVFVRADVDSIVEDALESAFSKVEEFIRRKKRERAGMDKREA